MATRLRELAQILNAPEVIPEGARDFVFHVDGLEIQAIEQAHGVILQFALDCSEDLLPEMAQYSAGRLLREEAALAWDARAGKLFLWQELPSDGSLMLQGFERFVDSCEWWLARCAEKEVPQSVFPDIMIRP